MEPSITYQTRLEWHHNTFTPSLHLMPFCCHLHKYALCLLVVRRGLWKAASVVGSAGSACWCVWWVWVHGCNVATCPVCRNCRVYEQCWICMVYLVCCEILLLLNMADMGCLLCGRLWSEPSWVFVLSVCMNRLSTCRELYVMCIVGKIAQDVGMVCKCYGVIPI